MQEKLFTVCFFGQMAQGKDESADHLKRKLDEIKDCGYWVRNGFAVAVKKVFMDTFGVTLEFIEKWKRNKEIPPGFLKNVRDSLIAIGNGFRLIQADIWIILAFKNQKHHQAISDGRFINEALAVKKRQGLNILLWRPGFENDIDNPSEQEVMPFVTKLKNGKEGLINDSSIPFDIFIKNDGTIKDLQNKVDLYVLPEIKRMIERKYEIA